MDKEKIIKETADFIKDKFEGESTGHDWWHIYRVWQDAKMIAGGEGADLFIVQMAALLHDLEDYKFHEQKEGERMVREWLEKQFVDKSISEKIVTVIEEVSFKGAGVKDQFTSLESKIISDADRLDAIGAMGIARAFAYGGKSGRPLYNPNVKPTIHKSFDEYKKLDSSTINHFYEKLLLLKDRMNTEKGKEIASSRHEFMKTFLKRFFEEWDGKA